jgi:hypothetical protein
MKIDFKKKFTSRKFIAMLTGVAGGIALLVSGNITEGAIALIASVVTYICAEANIDAKAVGGMLTDVAEKLESDEGGNDNE